MDYIFREFTIKELVDLIDENSVDLNPPYQRNYIWTPNDQKSLIDTIIKGFPLPTFFLYLERNGKYEMVDGQQRSKTIYRFVKGLIKSSKATHDKSFNDLPTETILNYKLPFIVIQNLSSYENLREFYVLINKKGVHLNIAEVNKSEHLDKLFLKLANEILDYQNFIELNLFTEASQKRMNDRAYVEELIGYLKLGIREKKVSVKEIYNEDINEDEYDNLKEIFYNVIDKISILNQIKPLAQTRYKQKNDFYTLFMFINENNEFNQELLNYQYQILLILDRSDSEGKQYIRPTNEDSFALKEYAINCVSQSNSKNAREGRMLFFNSILKNIDVNQNEILIDVLNYLADINGAHKVNLKSIQGFELLDVGLLN